MPWNNPPLIKVRSLSRGAAVCIGLNTLTGVAWGIGWATCVSAYQYETGQIVLGHILLPFQIGGLGLLLAVGAIVTLALLYHMRQPFWRALLCALVAACLIALIFYGALAFLAALFPPINPAQLEDWLMPLGWALDNAVLWLVMQHIDVPKQLEFRLENSNELNSIFIWRRFIIRLLLIVPLAVLWLAFLVARSALSYETMLAIVPLFVWGGLAVEREITQAIRGARSG